MGVSQAQSGLPDTVKAGDALKRIFDAEDRIPGMDSDADVPAPGEMKGDVRLRHVRFANPNRPGVTAFQDPSLDVPLGKWWP